MHYLYVEVWLPVDPVEALDDLIEWKELLRERGVDPFKKYTQRNTQLSASTKSP